MLSYYEKGHEDDHINSQQGVHCSFTTEPIGSKNGLFQITIYSAGDYNYSALLLLNIIWRLTAWHYQKRFSRELVTSHKINTYYVSS